MEKQSVYIYQPNRVTYAHFSGFSLLQIKVVVCIMNVLQKGMEEEMNGNNAFQLKLFKEPASELIRISIRLKEIARHDQYAKVIEAIKGLMNVLIEIESIDKKRISISHLITRMNVPKLVCGMTHVDVDLYKQTAKHLMQMEFNSKGQPVQFTRYLYNVAINAKSKFTPKFYMLLCSWKKKRVFRITLEELKYLLGLNKNAYRNYSDFKRFVLLPVQKDLENIADCWFNCMDKNFEIKKGRKTIALLFTVIVPEMINERKGKWDYLYHLLSTYAGFQDKHMLELKSHLPEVTDTTALLVKVEELLTYCSEKKNEISNKTAYILQALKNGSY